MGESTDTVLTFGEFEVDPAKRVLVREGNVIHLKSKTFDLLMTLIDHPDQILSKNDLLELVWAGQIVEENNLTVHMATLRKALGETKNDRRYIVTVPGRGYRFIGKLSETSRNGASTNGHVANGVTSQTVETAKRRNLRRKHLVVTLVVLLVLSTIGIGAYFWIRDQSRVTVAAAPRNLSIRRLTTDGKAMNGALSGDGKLYVYSRAEDTGQSLWLGHVDGGEPILIRPAAPVSYWSLSFSPGGESIYFALGGTGVNRGTFRMPVFGGSPEKIKDEAYTVAFNPAGTRFAFVRSDPKTGESDVIDCDVSGNNESRLGSAPIGFSFVPDSIAWSPDGQRIAVAATKTDSGPTYDIYIVTIADGSVTKLTDQSWVGFGAVDWLADGTGMVVNGRAEESVRRQLWAVSYPSGKVERWITDLNRYDAGITLSTAANVLLTIQEQTQSNIWVASTADLSRAKQITDGAIGRMDGWYGVDWTPDGSIVYTNEVDGNNSIWIMNSDGTGRRQLIPTEGNNIYPSLSADGRVLVFQSSRSGKYAVWKAAVDGSDLKQMTTADIAAQPSLSPDGRWIVYVSDSETVGEMWRIPTGGGEPLKLAAKASWPRVSPDSRLIACGYESDGSTKLAIISMNGGEPIKLFDLPRTANLRLGARWTPDGKALMYRDWQNGIWRQNISGGEPQRLKGLPGEKLYAFDWSSDGKRFAYTRGTEIRDVVLINTSN